MGVPGELFRIEATTAMSLSELLLELLPLAGIMDTDRFCNDASRRLPRIQRKNRGLERSSGLAAVVLEGFAEERQDVLPRKPDRSGCRLFETHNQASQGGFPHPDSPTRPMVSPRKISRRHRRPPAPDRRVSREIRRRVGSAFSILQWRAGLVPSQFPYSSTDA